MFKDSFCEKEVFDLIGDAQSSFNLSEDDRLNHIASSFIKSVECLANKPLTDTKECLIRLSRYLIRLGRQICSKLNLFDRVDKEAYQLGKWINLWCESKSSELITVKRFALIRHLRVS